MHSLELVPQSNAEILNHPYGWRISVPLQRHFIRVLYLSSLPILFRLLRSDGIAKADEAGNHHQDTEILSTLSILPLKTLILLFVTAVCLTSDTATSSVPQASPAPSLSVCSYWPVSSGLLPRSWAYPSWDLKSVTSESYLAVTFAPAMP